MVEPPEGYLTSVVAERAVACHECRMVEAPEGYVTSVGAEQTVVCHEC